MKENGLKEIRLTSLPTALSFHLKYGFKPYCINDNFRMRNILKEISSDSKSAGLLNKIAAKLLEDINNNGFISKTRNCYNEISDLIIKYAFMNKERWGTVPLKTHIPLVLTEQTVKANSVHFNNLYKKHELDYRI